MRWFMTMKSPISRIVREKSIFPVSPVSEYFVFRFRLAITGIPSTAVVTKPCP
jgi:hypothetical protein